MKSKGDRSSSFFTGKGDALNEELLKIILAN